LIHGHDLARAILVVHEHPQIAAGQRWLLTDIRVYDWWDLAAAWDDGKSLDASDNPQRARWVQELMAERAVRALPRPVEMLGRAMDSREFWETFRLLPERTLFSA
jgi:hypothetical protein